MKKYINKSVFVSLLAIFGLIACDQENDRGIYDASLPPAYSMFQPALISELVTANNGILKVSVSRTDASLEATIPVLITSTAPATLQLFKLVKPEVKFEKGQSQVNAEISFNLSSLSASSSYAFNITLKDSTFLSKGGNFRTAVTASRKLTWRSIGTGTYTSAFFEESWEQPVQQALEDPTLYRMPSCFTQDFPIVFAINSSTNAVTFSTQQTGYVSSANGMVSFTMPAAASTNQPKKTGSQVDLWGRFVVSAGSYGEFHEVLIMP